MGDDGGVADVVCGRCHYGVRVWRWVIVPTGLVIATDIEVVKATFAAFADRDLEKVLSLAHPDIEFTAVTGEHAGRTEPYRGHAGMRQYFRDVAAVWDELILVTGKVSARSRARTISGSTGWIWRVRDGKVVYGRVYGSAADAIAALEE